MAESELTFDKLRFDRRINSSTRGVGELALTCKGSTGSGVFSRLTGVTFFNLFLVISCPLSTAV